MSQQIGTLGTDKTKSLQVRIEDYKGKQGVDIREWYEGADKKMYPTTKGLRINIDMVSQLITYLEHAEQILVKEGHITLHKSP